MRDHFSHPGKTKGKVIILYILMFIFVGRNWEDECYYYIRGLLEKYPTFGREKETGLPGALDT